MQESASLERNVQGLKLNSFREKWRERGTDGWTDGERDGLIVW